ncbi:hypothetical protein LshimejAT787_0113110 [Lyophyllum shimeji]|uniref:Uncharacterized protein n=1 Tax=Lyophyllum shimeji TaxID=47721 RepID=A0A9P3PFE5_LYOSH|nr:hypothetical protein LshimejAT787_0113110 [Lyophyllum shimeji]
MRANEPVCRGSEYEEVRGDKYTNSEMKLRGFDPDSGRARSTNMWSAPGSSVGMFPEVGYITVTPDGVQPTPDHGNGIGAHRRREVIQNTGIAGA